MDFRLSLRNGLVSWMVVLLGISAGSPLLGSLQAQDMDAVQKRLLRAVKQRELSMEQATMMMRVLRDSSHHGAHSGQIDRGRRQPAQQEQGRQEQGRRQSGQQNEGRRVPLDRPDGRRQGTDRRPDHDRMKELERMFAQRIREIDEAVRAGEISEEEANHHRGETERWFESQHREGGHDEEGHHDRGHDERAHHEELERMFAQRIREIDKAVRSGQISEEEAEHHRGEAERWFESQHRDGGHDEEVHHEREHDERAYHEELERMFAQRIREIDEAVRSGQISEEEANHHRGETERWFESQHRKGGHDEEGHHERQHDERAHHEELERIFGQRMREIDEAVRSGEISEEEANRYRMEAERWMESEHREGEQHEHEHEHEHEHGPDHDREEDRDGEPGEAEAAREADK